MPSTDKEIETTISLTDAHDFPERNFPITIGRDPSVFLIRSRSDNELVVQEILVARWHRRFWYSLRRLFGRQ